MPDKKPVIALTGATGFVGRQVLRKFVDQGFTVRSLVRPGSIEKVERYQNVNWVEGRLADAESERELTRGADVVIHIAGLITARSKADYQRINADAVGSLAASANPSGVKRFIYLSSLAARVPELSWYAWSKHQGELALEENFDRMNTVHVRAPAVFGAEDKATAPIYAAVRKGFLPAPGGRNWRSRRLSLIHIEDLADFLFSLAVDHSHDGLTVSPSTRADIGWEEFAARCQDAIGSKVRPFAVPLTIFYSAATITTLVKAISGRGHLTLGKLREFLYDDWSVNADLQTGTDLVAALKKTIIE